MPHLFAFLHEQDDLRQTEAELFDIVALLDSSDTTGDYH